ncbi:MAG: PaaX family transcriptional regulator C-terminal domain-containing protein [Oceanococcaceae bacterium]
MPPGARRPTTKKIILGLLLARRNRPLHVKVAIRACSLFDLTPNNVRVTLVRLSADGLIQSPERGLYVLGPQAEGMAGDVAGWREALQRLRPWDGRWALLVAAPAVLGERAERKRRLQALGMLGFAELDAGAWIRPDNLEGGVAVLRERLLRLGLPRGLLLVEAQGLDEGHAQRAMALWDPVELQEGYAQQAAFLEQWQQRWPAMDLEQAARECYLFGTQAIRRLVFDPWLPDTMIDARARERFFRAVREFDATGQLIWQRLFDDDSVMPAATGSQDER